MTDFKNIELKCVDDINTFLELNVLDEISDDDELSEFTSKLSILDKSYRDVHTDLKSELGDEEYLQQFPKHTETKTKVHKNIQDAMRKLRANKRGKTKSQKTERQTDLLCEKDFLIKQSAHLHEKFFPVETSDLNELSHAINTLENHLSELMKVQLKIENVFDDFDAHTKAILKVEKERKDDISLLQKAVTDSKKLLDEEQQKFKTDQNEQSRIAAESSLNEQKLVVEHLMKEIEIRCESFESKIRSVSISAMTGHQLMEAEKRLFDLDRDFGEILDKITSLMEKGSGSKLTTEMAAVATRRDTISKVKQKYFDDLKDEIKKRDLSEEKLKNALSLDLKLPKFSGYDSQLDIFTFRREFKKLVEPYISRIHWSDTLKWKYLSGQALTLIESMDDIDKIWQKLESTFGDVQILMQNKLISLGKVENLWEIKSDEKRITAISSLLNSMTELSSLAEDHSLTNELFYGGGVEKVLSIMGNERKRKFVRKSENRLKGPDAWVKIREMLEKELSECEKLALFEKSEKLFASKERKGNGPKTPPESGGGGAHNVNTSFQTNSCHICGEETDHVKTVRGERTFIQYFACKTFVDKKCSERLKLLNDKNLCPKCLRPGMKKGHKGACYKQYLCPDQSHSNNNRVHVLLCGDHCNSEANQALLGKYKSEIMEHLVPNMKPFSKSIKICNFSASTGGCSAHGVNSQSDKDGPSIFQLQTINIEGHSFNLFFDNGCGDLVIKRSAAEKLLLLGRASQVVPGPLPLTGVGGIEVVSNNGLWQIRLPLRVPTKDGESDAIMSGLCLDKVTGEFPNFPLKTVDKVFKSAWENLEKTESLPKLPKMVGGETDIIIGSQYLKHCPHKILELDSGLALYESKFVSADGSTGVVGGPHPSFDLSKRPGSTHHGLGAYICQGVEVYRRNWKAGLDVPLLGYKELDSSDDVGASAFPTKRPPRNQKIFEQVEEAGTDVSYRCVDCRGCTKCKTSGRIESISIQEEVEQALIERSVTVYPEQGYTEAMLPFTCDPKTRLKTNLGMAKQIYRAQVKKLSKSDDDKQQVIESESKLQTLGFVEYLDDLPEDERELVLSSDPKYFIPWTVVWNTNSVSTSTRLVFDASRKPPEGCALNDILPKGVNGMNKLVEILIRWSVHRCAFHCDIQKMYNTIRLDKAHWCYQLYLWSENLELDQEPRWKVIKTLIYGVVSSGNQAEYALRKTAQLNESKYPRASEIIHKCAYVDDNAAGEKDRKTVEKTTRDLKLVLGTGGFALKGITISGEDPPEHLSDDGVSVNVGGMKWFPKGDFLKLNIGELNFSKKARGKKDASAEGVIPENLTRKHCVSKSYEIFDPIGKAVPVTCGFKVDLKRLTNLGWDDKISDEDRKIWESNFALIGDLRDAIFVRTVVPEDALNLDIETIDVADASNVLMCAAIYARFQLKSGEYSCQLVFARSKLVPDDTSIPRAELSAAVLNAAMGHVVKISFGEFHKGHIKLTDSQVALHWICTVKTELKLWVRNRVIEVNRLSPMTCWFYCRTEDNIADMGTRKGQGIEALDPEGEWFNGKPCYRLPVEQMPFLTVEEVVLTPDQLTELNKERISPKIEFQVHWASMSKPSPDSEIEKRYEFSDYVLDPNKFRFKTSLRIVALVVMFVQNLMKARHKRDISLLNTQSRVLNSSSFSCGGEQYLVTVGKDESLPSKPGMVISVTDDYIQAALRYFFLKGTAEVKNFVNKKRYADFTTEENGILYNNSRILPSETFGDPPSFSDAVLDLCSSSFVVPVLDFKSPIAYALMLETHRYHPDASHAGVETVLRFAQTVAFILNGRNLAKEIGKYCIRCRIRNRARMKVMMGPLAEANLKIAPAFYTSQVDLFGPFSSYSNANKRATIKVWFVLHCCCVTGAVDVKLMEDYSADSFLLAFIRFSCRYGYPKTLLIDEGSQLVKGCKDMVISFVDLSHKLNFEYGIDFRTCPVGAHYMNGRAERKIQQVQKSMEMISNERLSILQWETLMASIANSVNNLPLGLGNKVESLENLDLITPNRLLLGRNNHRSPTSTLSVTDDHSKILASNERIFKAWFKAWLVSYVPELIKMTKWFKSDEQIKVGDVVLFTKSDKAFETQYQYGLVTHIYESRDGFVRKAEIEYQNHSENTKRTTVRGVRELVVIHKFEETSIDEILFKANLGHSSNSSATHVCGCSFNDPFMGY